MNKGCTKFGLEFMEDGKLKVVFFYAVSGREARRKVKKMLKQRPNATSYTWSFADDYYWGRMK